MDQGNKAGETHHGWVVTPSANRMLAFRGELLHCVLPGVGPSPSAAPSLKRKRDDGPELSHADDGPEGCENTHDTSRRLTFMVAFWKEDPRARPFPTNSSMRWPSSFLTPIEASSSSCSTTATFNASAVQRIDTVFERLGTDAVNDGDESSGLDLLSPHCFTDFSALGSGLLIAGPKGACSLNCGGTCEVCSAATAAELN
jgi:hypothetical protein